MLNEDSRSSYSIILITGIDLSQLLSIPNCDLESHTHSSQQVLFGFGYRKCLSIQLRLCNLPVFQRRKNEGTMNQNLDGFEFCHILLPSLTHDSPRAGFPWRLWLQLNIALLISVVFSLRSFSQFYLEIARILRTRILSSGANRKTWWTFLKII